MFLEHERFFFFLISSNKKIVNLGHQVCFIFSYLEKVLKKETQSWIKITPDGKGVFCIPLCVHSAACHSIGNNTCDFAEFEPEVSPTVREHKSFERNKIFSGYIKYGTGLQ